MTWAFLWYWILPWFGLLFLALSVIVSGVATYVFLTAALYVRNDAPQVQTVWTRCTWKGKP